MQMVSYLICLFALVVAMFGIMNGESPMIVFSGVCAIIGLLVAQIKR